MDWSNSSQVWKEWDKGGRKIFMEHIVRHLPLEINDDKDYESGEEEEEEDYFEDYFEDVQEDETDIDDEDEFKRGIYALIKNGCLGVIRTEQVVDVLQDLVASYPISASLIGEIICVVDEESSVELDLRDNFIQFLQLIEPIGEGILLERINSDNLDALSLVRNKKIFNTRFIRIKTKLFFKQQKYNLFREESEGYAKLVAAFCPPFEKKSPKGAKRLLQCLVGRFNLDPNRILDIVLEAFECNPICGYFIPLIKSLGATPSTVCEILGFKLQNQDGPCDESLFLQLALLLQHKIIAFEDVFPWLSPEDRYIYKDWDCEQKDAKEYARKSMIVTINKEKEDEPEEVSSPDDRFSENQKFCFCEALLSVGDWEHAKAIIDMYPEYALVSRKRIAVQLTRLIDYVIGPLYLNIRKLSRKLGTPEVPILITNDKAPNQATTYGELQKEMDVILCIGPYIYHSPIVMYKLVRILSHYLKAKAESGTEHKSALYYRFLDVFDEVILPALSFLEANCSLPEEVFGALQYYPYDFRFRLYGSWKGEQLLLTHPLLLKKRVDLVKTLKHLMRRISKENVKQMGRQLGKLAHAMPGVVFDYILSQVQLFDNLIAPVVDAMKFMNNLCYDVLEFCVLEALSPNQGQGTGPSMSVMLMPNRPRTKHDGSTIASWLQNLSSFTGSVCKKYNIELIPVLQYVANQLKAKQGLDLLLLKEVVQKMTGLEASEDMTSEQLDAMGGGEMLRSEAGSFGQVRSAKKAGIRLREAVSANDLAITLCILMAQQRNCIVYEDTQELHTKLVGKLYDQCQDTLVQFGTFLANSCTMDDYSKKIPSLGDLVDQYHVSPDVAFFLWRPIISFQIGLKYDELRKAEKSSKTTAAQHKLEKYIEASNILFAPVAEVMRNFFSQKIWEDISPQFYVTFWSLSLYDLFVPSEAYAREMSRAKQASIAAAENKDLPSSKRKKEQERYAALMDKLQDEERRQKEHVSRVMAKLSQEKDSWFASRTTKSAKNEAVTAFLQHCLFPRCIFTALDAIYCAHFVTTIHLLSTPNFSTLICFDRIFCDINYTVTSCTENEAIRYGRFLCALLGIVMKWHGDKVVFDKECASFPGFVTKFRAANAMITECSDHVDYENFRHVCHKWHYKITKCIIVCLESKDFIQIRNALVVLMRILPYFPKVQNLATAVERWVERVRAEEKDKRQDLFALATSYIGQLKARWNTLVSEEDFHYKPKPVTVTDNTEGEKKASKPAADTLANDSEVIPKDKKKASGVVKQEKGSPVHTIGSPTSNWANPTLPSTPPNNRITNGTTAVFTPPPASLAVTPKRDNESPRDMPSPSGSTSSISTPKREHPMPNVTIVTQQTKSDASPRLLMKIAVSPSPPEEKHKEKKRSKPENHTTNGSPVPSVTPPSSPSPDDKERRRKEKKMDRKREREGADAIDSVKRKRTDDNYKSSPSEASSSSPKTSSRAIVVPNGELEKEGVSKESPTRHSSRDRSGSSRSEQSSSKKSHSSSRYK